ncbi:MAG: AAA family ATPase [Firmicutes bacterium]|nr:AAA family ATPase [Bacillota bacterium]
MKIKMKKPKLSAFIKYACITAVALGIAVAAFTKSQGGKTRMTYTDFLNAADGGEVAEVSLGDTSEFTFKLNSSDITYVTDNPRDPGFKQDLLLKGIAVTEGGAVNSGALGSVLWLALFGAGFYAVFHMRSKNGGQKAHSEMALNAENVTAGDMKRLSFGDIAGNLEAKESVADVVDFIKNPGKYASYGARMPRGIIFYGPPGTGKTLMAKAIAGEAGAPFYAVSGSDFVQMYVGVGAGRIRELFKTAREAGQAVIFIDEIDALAKKRGANPGGGNEERDHALNALLTEMSGFSSGDGIVVIAATNRLDTLDEALLRPGRFDRQIEIGLPDCAARLEILRCHARNKPLDAGVDLGALAKQTVYFSGAMLENLLNEAAIIAAKKGEQTITAGDINDSYYIIVAGSPKKDRSGIKERERAITAYHEAGHALASKLLQPENSVAKISIIPGTKGAGGFTVSIPPDKLYYTKKELENQMIMLFSGRAAEEIAFGAENVTTGASNDLERVRQIARDYVTKFNMRDGFFYDKETEKSECEALLGSLYEKSLFTLRSREKTLSGIAASLLEHETLDEKALDELIA